MFHVLFASISFDLCKIFTNISNRNYNIDPHSELVRISVKTENWRKFTFEQPELTILPQSFNTWSLEQCARDTHISQCKWNKKKKIKKKEQIMIIKLGLNNSDEWSASARFPFEFWIEWNHCWEWTSEKKLLKKKKPDHSPLSNVQWTEIEKEKKKRMQWTKIQLKLWNDHINSIRINGTKLRTKDKKEEIVNNDQHWSRL